MTGIPFIRENIEDLALIPNEVRAGPGLAIARVRRNSPGSTKQYGGVVR